MKPARRRFLSGLGVLALTPVAWGRAETQPGQSALASLLARTDDWVRWGSGDFTWFGFSVYSATLWVAGDDWRTAPHALQLTYHRPLSASRLVEASLDSLALAGAGEGHLAQARSYLTRLLPDVAAGDTVRAVHVPGIGLRFYHRGAWRGDVEDAAFARRFMAIWLGPETRAPALRTALLTPPGKVARDG
jgi:hypothetical protein